jgi:transcriptional regulator with XRE-family HTH domain
VTQTVFNSLRQLRTTLGYGQKDFAALCGCSTHTIQSVELGRLALSSKLAFRISQLTGCDFGWLLANDPARPLINHEGLPFRQKDFEFAQAADLENLRFFRIEPKMELGVAYDLLCRLLEATVATGDDHAVAEFRRRVETFIRTELARCRPLQEEVYAQLRADAKQGVAKSFLFPREIEAFQRGKRNFTEAIHALGQRRAERLAKSKSGSQKVITK